MTKLTKQLRLVKLHTFSRRMKGLLCRTRPPGPRSGVWLQPCNAVHTLGMRYAIDVAFLDTNGRVLRLLTLPPWRMAVCWKAASVIETRAGVLRSNMDIPDP